MDGGLKHPVLQQFMPSGSSTIIYGVQTPLLSAIDANDVGDADADVSLHLQTPLSDRPMAILYRLSSIHSSPKL